MLMELNLQNYLYINNTIKRININAFKQRLNHYAIITTSKSFNRSKTTQYKTKTIEQ